jgi:hypothetical protein
MKSRPTQFDMRENTASTRRHASRLAVDSLPSKSAKAIPRSSQHRQPTPVLTYCASESDMSIITMPLEAATGGETGDSAEIFSAPTAVISGKESRQVLLTPEPFVSADEAAQILCVKRRYLLELARRGMPEPMRSAQGANAESGCFDSRNSPSRSYGMRLRFQNLQNRVRSGLAVPAEKRSYVLSAKITQESETQGRRNLGAAVSGYEFRRQKGRERHAYRACPGISEG